MGAGPAQTLSGNWSHVTEALTPVALVITSYNLFGPNQEEIVLFSKTGGNLQRVSLVSMPDEVAGILANKAENPQATPLQSVRQFVGQEPLRKPHSPSHQNRIPPGLRLGPGRDEPRHEVDSYRDKGVV
jgi:hypothetical protein